MPSWSKLVTISISSLVSITSSSSRFVETWLPLLPPSVSLLRREADYFSSSGFACELAMALVEGAESSLSFCEAGLLASTID